MEYTIDHKKVPSSIVSLSSIEYYERTALNPYIQHVLPGFQFTLVHSTNTTDDDVRSYWNAVEDNVPNSDDMMSCDCVDSYGTNIVALTFAFAYVLNSQPITLELSMGQALALYQANGLIDAVSSIKTSISKEHRVVLFGKFYRPLASMYKVISIYTVLFVIVAIGVDIIHHLLQILATLWRFLRQPSVAFNKTLYHIFHWISLWVSFCTKNEAPLNWSLSHEYERMEHVIV